MEQTTTFYQIPGSYTNPTHFRQLLRSLPDDYEEIIKFIKKVLIHPIDAKSEGVHFNYKKTLRSQVDHRSIDDILTNPQVNVLLKLNTIDLQSTPSQRGIFSCDHHVVLFASILRLKGKAVRARCGYWICEVYNEHRGRWEYIDPERVKLKFMAGDFFPGGKVWLEVGQGRFALDRVMPDYRRGLDGIKYRLLNDMNALMKNELLNYDWMLKQVKPPRLFSRPVSRLDEGDCILLDILATLSLNVDVHRSDICDQYNAYVLTENHRMQE